MTVMYLGDRSHHVLKTANGSEQSRDQGNYVLKTAVSPEGRYVLPEESCIYETNICFQDNDKIHVYVGAHYAIRAIRCSREAYGQCSKWYDQGDYVLMRKRCDYEKTICTYKKTPRLRENYAFYGYHLLRVALLSEWQCAQGIGA